MPVGEGFFQTRGRKKAPHLKDVILPLLACLAWKWLQIGTDMLLIITSTNHKLFMSVNIDNPNDIEPQNRGF